LHDATLWSELLEIWSDASHRILIDKCSLLLESHFTWSIYWFVTLSEKYSATCVLESSSIDLKLDATR
jgi:hypothetical protein